MRSKKRKAEALQNEECKHEDRLLTPSAMALNGTQLHRLPASEQGLLPGSCDWSLEDVGAKFSPWNAG